MVRPRDGLDRDPDFKTNRALSLDTYTQARSERGVCVGRFHGERENGESAQPHFSRFLLPPKFKSLCAEILPRTMTAINVTSVNVLDNPSPVTNPLQYVVVVVVVVVSANRSPKNLAPCLAHTSRPGPGPTDPPRSLAHLASSLAHTFPWKPGQV